MVDQPSAYNAIFGRPLMRATKIVIATFHMKVRFPTSSGDGYMECNQRTARRCRIAVVALTRKGDKPSKETKILEDEYNARIESGDEHNQLMQGDQLDIGGNASAGGEHIRRGQPFRMNT